MRAYGSWVLRVAGLLGWGLLEFGVSGFLGYSKFRASGSGLFAFSLSRAEGFEDIEFGECRVVELKGIGRTRSNNMSNGGVDWCRLTQILSTPVQPFLHVSR